MTVFTSLYAIPNHDRIESWRGAFRYLKQAEPLFQVRPKNRINLLVVPNAKAQRPDKQRTGTATSNMLTPWRMGPYRGKPHRRAETGPDFATSKRPRRVAVPSKSVSPTDGRKRGTDFNEKPPGSIRFVCTCALDAIVFVVGLLLAFGMLVVAGVVMGVV